MRPVRFGTEPPPRSRADPLRLERPAPNAAGCTWWDRSDIPVRPTGSRSELLYDSVPPIRTDLLQAESAGKRTGGSFLRSRTLEPEHRTSSRTQPSNRVAPALAAVLRAAPECLRETGTIAPG